MADYAVVVGAVNMDVGGCSDKSLLLRDSNPGKVRLSPGGVGRNIACNLTMLGCKVKLLTAFGDDLYAKEIASSCSTLGIDLSQALTVPGEPTSTYLFIAGNDGDMALAVSDMDICRSLTPEYLEGCRETLDGARVVVLDANLPEESIRWLCEHVSVPVFADPVSTAKARKLGPVLGRLHTLKPNRIEVQTLSGVKVSNDKNLKRAANALLNVGLERVFISLGSDGVYAADHAGSVRLPSLPIMAANATGAGDAFMAALAWSYLKGVPLRETAALAQAAAAIAVEGAGTINPDLTADAVTQRAKLLLY